MKNKANPTIIGAFVLGSLTLLIGTIIVFGSGRLLTPKASFVVFFQGNVSGLQPGAHVSFRGVQIGEVRDVDAVIDPEEVEIHIKVVIEVLGNAVLTIDGPADSTEESIEQGIMFLVNARDLRAKLQSWSVVTGQLYVDLDFYPGTPAQFVGLEPELHEIPAVPSDMQRLRGAFVDTMQTLRELPLGEVLRSVQTTVDSVNTMLSSPELEGTLGGVHRLVNAPEIASILAGLDRTVNNPQIGEAISGLNRAINDAQGLVSNIEGKITPVLENLDRTVLAARDLLVEIDHTVGRLETSVGNNVELQHQVGTTLDELARAARSVRMLADYLERHPESLLRGKGATQ
ncbi:MAG: paraquat-inducible protein B [Hyphomicrobiaceae bacterium]